MQKKHLIIFTVITLWWQVSAKWKAIIQDTDQNTLLQKGSYKKYLIKFEKMDENTSHTTTTIYLDKDASTEGVETNTGSYQIDTFTQNPMEIYIGVSCLVNIATDKIKFKFREEPENKEEFIFEETEVGLSTLTSKIDLYSLKNSIPKNSKSRILVDFSILNVDAIEFKFQSQDSSEKATITDFIFESYTLERDRNLLIYGTDVTTGDNNGKTTFTVSLNNTCFTVQDSQIEVSVDTNEIPDWSNKKEQTVKEISILNPKDKDEIQIGINFSFYPAIISCVCQRTEEALLEDSQLRELYKEIENKDFRLFQHFIDSQEGITISFSRISRLGDFKVKCLVDNTAVKQEKFSSFSFTIGEFGTADKQVPLMPERDKLTPGICATWTFDAKVDLDIFTDKAKQLCLNEIDKLNTGKVFSENGCMRCIPRPNQYLPENSASICFLPETDCKTSYQSDPIAHFEEVVEKMRSKEDIAKNLGLNDYGVKKFETEADTISPDLSLFTFTREKIYEKKISFKATYNGEQSVECILKKPKSEIDKKVWVADIISGGQNYVFQPNITYNFEIEFETEGYSYDILNIMGVCYNIPGSECQIQSTGAFRALSFLKQENIEKEDTPDTKVNCAENPIHRQCLLSFGHQPFAFRSTNPMQTRLDQIDDFQYLNEGEQKTLIKFEVDAIQESDIEIESKIERSIVILTLLSKRNCRMMKNFDKCTEEKKTNYMTVYDIIISILGKDKFMNVIKEQQASEAKQLVIKFAWVLFAFTNDADSIDYKDYPKIFEYLQAVIEKGNDWKEFVMSDEDYAKDDFVSVLIAASANLNDFISYAEADKNIEADPKTWILKSSYLNQQKLIMEKAINLLLDLKAETLSYETFHYKYYQKLNRLRNLEETAPDIIEFDSFDIEVGILPFTLMQKYNATYIQVFAYQKYPFLSLNATSISNHFIGFRMLDSSKALINAGTLDKSMRPTVSYNLRVERDKFRECRRFNGDKNATDTSLISTEIKTDNNVTYTKCKVSSFGDITIAEKSKSNWIWLYVWLIILGLMIFAGVGYFIYSLMSKRSSAIPEIDNTATVALMASD